MKPTIEQLRSGIGWHRLRSDETSKEGDFFIAGDTVVEVRAAVGQSGDDAEFYMKLPTAEELRAGGRYRRLTSEDRAKKGDYVVYRDGETVAPVMGFAGLRGDTEEFYTMRTLPTAEELKDTTKWRALPVGEKIVEGDVLATGAPEWALGMIGAEVPTYQTWYRAVESGWIRTADRLPTKEDGGLKEVYPEGVVLARSKSGVVGIYYPRHVSTAQEYWITPPPLPPLPEKQIMIGEYLVEFKSDGVQVGCTFVPAETVRAIAEKLK